MRRVIALVVPLLILAACGNEEEIAAKKQTLKKVRAQYKALNAELQEKLKEWGPIKVKVIPARKEWLRAKASGNADAIATAKAVLDQMQAEANDVTNQETALKGRIRELRDKKNRLEDEILRLGGTP